MKLSQEEFEDAVLSGLKKLPKVLKNKMENIDVVVEEEASREILEDMGLRSPRHLLGLYQGIPFDRRGFYYGNVLPDKITLFKNPIESVCRNKDQVEKKVREVVIHEVGHYFGLDDERLEELGNGDEGE
jgi:predicted Zn-dependent protease with MMP-like domain